jgi:hypothetical protein
MWKHFDILKHSALIDANQPIEVPEKHHQSSGLLASLMVTLFTVWGIDHRRSDIAVSQSLLNRPDIIICLEQVARNTVAKRMG